MAKIICLADKNDIVGEFLAEVSVLRLNKCDNANDFSIVIFTNQT